MAVSIGLYSMISIKKSPQNFDKIGGGDYN